MARQYITVRRNMADIEGGVDGEDYLSRTVYEDRELIDIGILDHNGDPVMAMEKIEQIGFVHHKKSTETGI